MESAIDSFLLGIDQLSPILIFLFFFLSGFLQIAFPIYPGDTVLVFGGCLGGLSVHSVGTVALMGYLSATVVTSLLLYELGYRLNERIFRIGWIGRIMPMEQRLSVETKYKKFGVSLLMLCKFIPGVNSLVILLGGVLRYPRKAGMLAVVFSSVVHNLIFFYVGHMIGKNLDGIKLFLREYTIIAASLALVAAGVAAFWFIRKNRKGKNDHETHPDRG